MNILWLWLRAHRWPTLLAVCLGVAVLNVLVGGQGVPVPTLTSIRRLDLPLRQFLPLVMACAIGLHSRNPSQTFTVTPRPALVLRAGLAVALHVPAVVACLAVLLGEGMPETAGSLRNTLALTGLALMTSVIAGATRSWTTPLFFLMVCLLFGPRYDYAPTGGPSAELWAIVLAPPHDLTAAVLAGIVWLLGTALFILRGARAEIST